MADSSRSPKPNLAAVQHSLRQPDKRALILPLPTSFHSFLSLTAWSALFIFLLRAPAALRLPVSTQTSPLLLEPPHPPPPNTTAAAAAAARVTAVSRALTEQGFSKKPKLLRHSGSSPWNVVSAEGGGGEGGGGGWVYMRGSSRQEPRRVPSRQRFSSKLCKKLFAVAMVTTWQTFFFFCRFCDFSFRQQQRGGR